MPTYHKLSSINPLPIPTFIQRLTSAAKSQEGSEASVASSSPAPNWWEMHAYPIVSWNAMNRWQPLPNVPASSCEDRDVSASTNSGLSMDSSSADLSGDPTENHLWSQVLFSVGTSGGDLQSNLVDGFSSRTALTAGQMFGPAFNYLKNLENSWGFANHRPVLDGLNMNHVGGSGSMIGPERMTSLSDLIGNWSIAPPNTNSLAFDHATAQYHVPNILQSTSYRSNGIGIGIVDDPSMGYHDHGLGSVSEPAPIGLNKYCSGMADLISFGSSLNKPAMELRATKPSVKKQGYEASSSTRGDGRNSGTSEGKKKRSADSSETLFKKPKHENSNASSLKMQAPKGKVTDKITVLQQIVSPFGKTDTASVLLEAVNYIRFLQEQVQLLSDPYIKSSPNKEHNSWGSIERKEKGEPKIDLRSKGLCLVPTSCTPQVYRENNGPDYWTPTYRGCLYR